jgi:uncharacterized protein YjiS (DUF1127 family)
MTTSTNPPAFIAHRLFLSRGRAEPDLATPATGFVRYAVVPTLAVVRLLRSIRRTLRVWKVRRNDRDFLAGLQLFELSEMGVTTSERFHEVRKPLWEE